MPTLVINARDDHLAPYRFAAKAASRIPGARLVTIEAGGHVYMGTTLHPQGDRHLRRRADFNAFARRSGFDATLGPAETGLSTPVAGRSHAHDMEQ